MNPFLYASMQRAYLSDLCEPVGDDLHRECCIVYYGVYATDDEREPCLPHNFSVRLFF